MVTITDLYAMEQIFLQGRFSFTIDKSSSLSEINVIAVCGYTYAKVVFSFDKEGSLKALEVRK